MHKKEKNGTGQGPCRSAVQMCWAAQGSGHCGHHLPVSRSCFLVLGIGALGVTAEVRTDLIF